MDWGIISITLVLVGVTLALLATFKGCLGTGKYITRPMALMWAIWMVRRSIKRGRFSGTFSMRTAEFRVWQLLALFAVNLWFFVLGVLNPGFPSLPFNIFCYWVPFCALYADDLLTLIDRDKWKKRWKTAKNKLKWKWTPAPVPIKVGR